jgi:D-glycero-alpha-D-manno-heptose-7-phosphate kinase
VAVEPETLRKFNEQTMLFFTGVERSADTILCDQRDKITEHEDLLCRMRDQVTEARSMLEAGDAGGIGPLLMEGWGLKKQLSTRISNESINEMFQRAIDAGAAGGKISGAGGGGFMLLLCPTDRKDAVRAALTGLTEMHFALARDGSKMIFNVRR